MSRVKQFLMPLALAIVVTGCSLPAGHGIRAFNTCIARHPGETALCEGPRQAYEVDAPTLRVGTGSITGESVSSH
jgi:hypothetical protein